MGWLIYNYKELYIFDLESFCVECFTPFFLIFIFSLLSILFILKKIRRNNYISQYMVV